MRKALTDEEFFDGLIQLFLAEGVRNLTVGEMASRLRCSRRRLYDIAQTKEEIFCTTVSRFFYGILEEGNALTRSEKNLTAAIAAYLEVGVRAASRIGVQFLKDVEDSEAARTIFDNYQQARTVRLSQLIDEGVSQGVFVKCHGLVVSELILGAALRLRRPAFLAKANLTIEDAFQEFYRILLGGLMVETAPLKLVEREGQARKANVRGLSETQPPTGDDEVGTLLLDAWNRD
ncbi:hypothetical protein [Ottowia thiooxydans]|uniref:hypothetical protein n=1 Tax=Ottowia thiooxydans TaxID=219182 RepID=UPI00041F37F1|nr:hypothetical protein [Ottowia thiooxydans]